MGQTEHFVRAVQPAPGHVIVGNELGIVVLLYPLGHPHLSGVINVVLLLVVVRVEVTVIVV